MQPGQQYVVAYICVCVRENDVMRRTRARNSHRILHNTPHPLEKRPLRGSAHDARTLAALPLGRPVRRLSVFLGLSRARVRRFTAPRPHCTLSHTIAYLCLPSTIPTVTTNYKKTRNVHPMGAQPQRAQQARTRGIATCLTGQGLPL